VPVYTVPVYCVCVLCQYVRSVVLEADTVRNVAMKAHAVEASVVQALCWFGRHVSLGSTC